MAGRRGQLFRQTEELPRSYPSIELYCFAEYDDYFVLPVSDFTRVDPGKKLKVNDSLPQTHADRSLPWSNEILIP